MTKPIYSSTEHEAIIETYLNMCKEFAKDVSSKNRYNNYLDVVETVLEYHNNYGSGSSERAYKTVLNEMVGEVVNRIDDLQDPSE